MSIHRHKAGCAWRLGGPCDCGGEDYPTRHDATKPPVEALPYAENHGKVSALSSAVGLFGDNKPPVLEGEHTAEVCGHLSGRFTKLRCKLAPNHKPFPHQCGAFTWEGDPHEGAENRFHRAGCDRLTIADDRARFHFGAE